MYIWRSFEWQGMYFRNPTGIAGGLDKDGENILDWQSLGAGFLELGTVTPLPQAANDGVIVNRDHKNLNVWNRMGFPNRGAGDLASTIASRKSECMVPLFVNLGRNRWTENSHAHMDYCYLIRQFASLADALVINISSPNTTGLRDLFAPDVLAKFLRQLFHQAVESKAGPLILKLSPDLEDNDLVRTIEVALDCGFMGFILTNTTTSRQTASNFPEVGGVSGRALAQRSKRCLSLAREIIEKNRRTDCLLVSVGGIFTYSDVVERLNLGAHLVQFYSALVFEGPNLFSRIAKEARGGPARHQGKTSEQKIALDPSGGGSHSQRQ